MLDLSITVDPSNGRSPRRVVHFSSADKQHTDTLDPFDGFARGKCLDRVAQKFGIPRHRLTALDDAILDAAEKADSPTDTVEYPVLTALELDAAEYKTEYLIEGILAAGQHTIGGGPQKSLKTLVLGCDLAFSLATGGHWLGYFRVSRPTRTALMSGESGYSVLQDNFRRIVRAAGGELRDVPNLLVSDHLPKFGHLDHTDAMGKFLQENGIEVVVIDPAYLCMEGRDAGNVFEMGALLRSMGDVFVEHRATLILLHHATKPASLAGEPIDLADLSFAGFREFAASWLLLNRRAKYEPGSGHHELWLSAGGRAGHSGLWGLDVDEGEYHPGVERSWDVHVLTAEEAREQTRTTARAESDGVREHERRERLEADKVTLVRAMAKYPDGETERTLHGASGLYGTRFRLTLAELVSQEDVVPCEVTRQCRKAPYDGWKLTEEDTPHG